MMFTLLLEVEAPENSNPEFPKAAYAIQWLQDQLQLAIAARQRKMRSPHFVAAARHDWAVSLEESTITKIEESIKTIRPHDIDHA